MQLTPHLNRSGKKLEPLLHRSLDNALPRLGGGAPLVLPVGQKLHSNDSLFFHNLRFQRQLKARKGENNSAFP